MQAKSPQHDEERLQLRLVFLDDVIRLVVLPGHQHLSGEAGQAVVVAQVEPAIVPPAVR
jgi:hypothetical protein